MRQSYFTHPPGLQGFLTKLAKVDGRVTIHGGVVTFPDGTTADLSSLTSGGVGSCWHCGALMNDIQRYICGCPKCIEPLPITSTGPR